MATVTNDTLTTDTTRPRTGGQTLFAVLIGLATLAVLLQGLWAGLFLQHDGGRNAAQSWITVHSRGSEVSLALAALATIVAFVRLRSRRDLWVGSAALTVLIALESYLGGRIVDNGDDSLTVVHIPLAMALMGLAVWLAVRMRRRA